MNSLKTYLLLLCVLLLNIGCGDTENEYSNIRCYVVFNNATHLDATLASAMNPSAPGIYCKVSTTFNAGVNYFAFRNNQGQESLSKFDAEDARRSLTIGLNNGIIVGFSNLTQPATFYAFDAECPNCFDPAAVPVKSKPLEVSTSGIATCKACNRQYTLNNGGMPNDGGKKLTRYHATSTGPYGMLSVQ